MNARIREVIETTEEKEGLLITKYWNRKGDLLAEHNPDAKDALVKCQEQAQLLYNINHEIQMAKAAESIIRQDYEEAQKIIKNLTEELKKAQETPSLNSPKRIEYCYIELKKAKFEIERLKGKKDVEEVERFKKANENLRMLLEKTVYNKEELKRLKKGEEEFQEQITRLQNHITAITKNFKNELGMVKNNLRTARGKITRLEKT